PLANEVALETGIESATVVATATHDTASAVVGTPLADQRSAFISIGTWSLVGVEALEPSAGETAYQANVTNEAGVGGTFRVLRNVTGLWLLEECRRAWSLVGCDWPLAKLLVAAGSAPKLRALIDPNDQTFAAPGDMPSRIVDYCTRTGQQPPQDEGAFARCILESLALAQAKEVDLLGDVTGRTLDQLHVVGGGAHNELLCAWTASAAERPVLAGPAEATLVGNLLIQALALGELGSVADAREVVRRSFVTPRYEPTGEAEWQEARERFAHLVDDRTPLGACA
ncbi:MAG: FGGY-family carbohydrate kinase, partial [Solirubrobacteraceae bacterium]